MPMIKRCCFSRNLRNGAIASGIWTLVWCFYLLAISVWGLTTLNVGKFVADNQIGTDETSQSKPTDNPVLGGLVWTTLCVSFLTFLSSILVIVAVFKNNASLMLPWMVMVAVLLLLDAATIISDVILHGFLPEAVAGLMIWVIVSLINIYCELCVISHYQEVKIGRGRYADYLGIVVRRPPSQRVTAVVYAGDIDNHHLVALPNDDTETLNGDCDVDWVDLNEYPDKPSRLPSNGVLCDTDMEEHTTSLLCMEAEGACSPTPEHSS